MQNNRKLTASITEITQNSFTKTQYPTDDSDFLSISNPTIISACLILFIVNREMCLLEVEEDEKSNRRGVFITPQLHHDFIFNF